MTCVKAAYISNNTDSPGRMVSRFLGSRCQTVGDRSGRRGRRRVNTSAGVPGLTLQRERVTSESELPHTFFFSRYHILLLYPPQRTNQHHRWLPTICNRTELAEYPL